MKIFCFALAALVSLIFVLDANAQSANRVTYIYDELGRLVGVVNPSGETVIYTYDEVGNLLSTSRQSSTQLSIIEFTPNRGAAGATITIYGSGFSTGTSENAVHFNGTAATVTSSTTLRITTSVPAGATTGPITVTTPSGSITSSASFIVGTPTDDPITPGVPTISGFTPTIGLPGTAVTITGSNFESLITDNKITFGGTPSGIDSATPVSIITPAPKGGSGRISVTTPQGTAVSSTDFFVPPPPYKVEDVRYAERISFRTNTIVRSAEGNTVSLMIFDGKAGDRISLHMFDWTSAFDIRIYQPDEKILASNKLILNQGAKAFLDTKVLPLTGTYTILVTTSAIGQNNLTLKLYDVPPDVTGTLTPGRHLYVNIQTPGQNGELTFNGEAGQKVVVIMEDNTIPSGTTGLVTGGVIKQVISQGSLPPPAPAGGSTSVSYMAAAIRSLELPPGNTLPTTGPVTIKVDPTGDSIGQVKVTLYLQPPDPSLSITPGGSPVTVGSVPHESAPMVLSSSSSSGNGATAIPYTTPPANGPGTNWWLVFDGTAGQKVSLTVSNVTLPGTTYVSLNKPDGTYLLGRTPVGTNGTFIDALTLPVTGTYKFFVDPSDGSTGQATFKLHDVPPDAAGTIEVGGTHETRSITVPGQNLALTFAVTQGQQVSLEISEITIPGTTIIYVKKSDGTNLTWSGFSTNGGLISPITLPQPGTYTVYVDPYLTNTGSITLQLGGQPSGEVGNRMELASSVSVRRGLPAGSEIAVAQAVSVWLENGRAQTLVLGDSVSVKRGSALGTSEVGAVSVSVRRGSVSGEVKSTTSVSVTTGPYVSSMVPGSMTRGTTSTLTITGKNLSGTSVLKLINSSGIVDVNITVANIIVSEDGTTLTATISIGGSAALGRQIVVVTAATGSSPPIDFGSNVIQISQ